MDANSQLLNDSLHDERKTCILEWLMSNDLELLPNPDEPTHFPWGQPVGQIDFIAVDAGRRDSLGPTVVMHELRGLVTSDHLPLRTCLNCGKISGLSGKHAAHERLHKYWKP
ncbi:unnamed protein product, partial [Polarella glacialis]